jgi:glycosyltransferase involved in cell wall biosynthesis
VFGALGCATELVGFTSGDRLEGRPGGGEPAFLHLAGQSRQKGTDILLDLWRKHPEWPTLTVVIRPNNPVARDPGLANVRFLTGFLEDCELRRLQNDHLFHLCPSEVEGFGHSLVEAMSCGAVTLTTDAPPMNELVTPERGMLVPYHAGQPQRLGMNYYVDPEALERCIEEMLAMPAERRAEFGANARDWYLRNDARFRARLVETIERNGRRMRR